MSDEAPTVKKVRIDKFSHGYVAHPGFMTATGRQVSDNSDYVSEIIRGMPVAGVRLVLEANGGTWRESWDALNPGMQRMAAGNVLRGIFKKLIPGDVFLVPEAAKTTVSLKPAKVAKPKKDVQLLLKLPTVGKAG